MPESKTNTEEEALAEAQQGFYQALESLDMHAMSARWMHEDWVQCLHPGGTMLRGWEAVRSSWESIFRSTLQLRVEVSPPAVVLRGDVAWVSCQEKVSSAIGDQFMTALLQSTNIFGCVRGRWMLVHRHTSVLPGPPMAEASQSVQ